MSMPRYEISGDRIIVVKPHTQGGTTHRELDPGELQLVELAKQLSGCTVRATNIIPSIDTPEFRERMRALGATVDIYGESYRRLVGYVNSHFLRRSISVERGCE